MGYDRCFGYDCFESRVSFPTDPVPRFKFTSRKHHLLPVTSSTQAPTTTTEAVKTIVETTFQTLIEEPTAAIASSEEKISEIFTSVPVNTEASTVQQIIDTVTQAINNQTAILNEDTTNNNGVLNITDIVNDNDVQESINSDSFPINPNIFTTPENEEIATTLSDIVTAATEKTISTIHSTTEKVMDIFASTIPAERQHEEHDNAASSHTGIYVILGIVVGVLLLVCILLIFLYLRHRKNNSHSLVEHPYYNIHPKNETVPSISDQDKEYQHDLYVQYKC